MNKKVWSFIVVLLLIPLTILYAATTGSIEISSMELIKGLFTGTNNEVAIIKDLRFPRIIIALFAGAALAVSGVLLQAVMRNPLAEPGIIGVSSGAGFMTIIMVTFFPTLYFYTPLFAFIGGAFAFFLVFTFSWKSGLNPLRMILIGVAINAVFVGLSELFSAGGNGLIDAVSVTSSTLSMKTWSDVEIMVLYGSIGLILAFIFFKYANHLGLRDQTLKSLGFRVNRARLILSIVAVLIPIIAIISTIALPVVVGSILIFNKELQKNAPYFHKQTAQLFSKNRFISAQFKALFTNELWKRMATHSNHMAQLLASEISEIEGVNITQKVQANAIFVLIPKHIIETLRNAYRFYDWNAETGELRWMCSFDTTEEDVRGFVKKLKELI